MFAVIAHCKEFTYDHLTNLSGSGRLTLLHTVQTVFYAIIHYSQESKKKIVPFKFCKQKQKFALFKNGVNHQT